MTISKLSSLLPNKTVKQIHTFNTFLAENNNLILDISASIPHLHHLVHFFTRVLQGQKAFKQVNYPDSTLIEAILSYFKQIIKKPIQRL